MTILELKDVKVHGQMLSVNPLAPLTTLQACFHEKHFYETQQYG